MQLGQPARQDSVVHACNGEKVRQGVGGVAHLADHSLCMHDYNNDVRQPCQCTQFDYHSLASEVFECIACAI